MQDDAVELSTYGTFVCWVNLVQQIRHGYSRLFGIPPVLASYLALSLSQMAGTSHRTLVHGCFCFTATYTIL